MVSIGKVHLFEVVTVLCFFLITQKTRTKPLLLSFMVVTCFVMQKMINGYCGCVLAYRANLGNIRRPSLTIWVGAFVFFFIKSINSVLQGIRFPSAVGQTNILVLLRQEEK